MTQLYIWMHQVCLCHSHMFEAKSHLICKHLQLGPMKLTGAKVDLSVYGRTHICETNPRGGRRGVKFRVCRVWGNNRESVFTSASTQIDLSGSVSAQNLTKMWSQVTSLGKILPLVFCFCWFSQSSSQVIWNILPKTKLLIFVPMKVISSSGKSLKGYLKVSRYLQSEDVLVIMLSTNCILPVFSNLILNY